MRRWRAPEKSDVSASQGGTAFREQSVGPTSDLRIGFFEGSFESTMA